MISKEAKAAKINELQNLANGCRGSEGKMSLAWGLWVFICEALKVHNPREPEVSITVSCEEFCQMVDELTHNSPRQVEEVEEPSDQDTGKIEKSEEEILTEIIRENVTNPKVISALEELFTEPHELVEYLLTEGNDPLHTSIEGMGEKTEEKLREALRDHVAKK